MSDYYESAEDAIKDLIACAISYDDKPHLLFSCIMRIAKQFEEDFVFQKEIVRLMDLAYYSNQHK